MSNKTTFELKYPFELNGMKYASFEGRRPTLRDLRNFFRTLEKDDSIKAVQEALAAVFGTTEAILGYVDIEDYAPMQAWFQDFLKLMAPSESKDED